MFHVLVFLVVGGEQLAQLNRSKVGLWEAG